MRVTLQVCARHGGDGARARVAFGAVGTARDAPVLAQLVRGIDNAARMPGARHQAAVSVDEREDLARRRVEGEVLVGWDGARYAENLCRVWLAEPGSAWTLAA